MENYDQKIKQILVATGWTQEALAAKLNTTFVTLNSWVNGKSAPRDAAKEKIDIIFADVLGEDAVDPDELKKYKARAASERCTAKRLRDNRSLLENYITALTYHSNATEGSTMTESDVRAVVYENKALKNRTAVEQREAINHQTALYFLLDELVEQGSNFEFTPELIKSVHLRMMNGIVSDAGLWRSHGVHVTGSNAPRANYVKIPELMTNWCNKINSETTDKIGLLAATHSEFEKIHPFSDGNGRTERLLLFAASLKLGLVPPVLRRDRRMAYYKYLELAHLRDLTDPLELYIAKSIIETADKLAEI